ncbi:tRNA (5-methylaminomethyl-2-thiouridine)(34)-methyltransferase MnmD [Lentimicrobium sp.]|jgi:tRNA U34 5-methylaminomethyl-2-thiouridine-forming methyltransferase MnmC|uniref:tRNA (5-methylaminomethyl-2-thiouridine)(34)-methyltransferase MnmD n=1 Tax=Lentimicrobium sp. TaxID=2034841 RepID=UPI002CC62199|nr:tRNA (5-methylaminomethyl-2-thiouridine)(34)-methyltransferase MnmD [Lentimicrobium sp.]MCO5262537.1 tRNA (5-methylaminomethyl-2-thiouridine)(34)-methyltransferase MnmD [Lentimicrobium sp.]HOP13011.1 tRNA (5-methylaminomethyl-2-thiouridine)(34)-methyltransferase MnmD [Lentimicrobium sp.]HPF64957.1 tRNA (5-methylaminomethyl-2-thiouridine)(34)-methyltransferase MnmD [Lentimicrobium sp.]HPR27134.1 tRNA (5-methylaminomethyl-2-thiouridine)(34)-methyltransferase MnmD [Lentimicrobium sp.]HRW69597.
MNHATEVVLTEDGSFTLLNRTLGEHYHSIHGAVQESRHVFLEAGYRYICNKFRDISILEVGFGTGLNALLTLAASVDAGVNTRYYGLEPFPPDWSVIEKINYCNLGGLEGFTDDFRKMHQAVPGEEILLRENFSFCLSRSRLEDTYPGWGKYNLVYFDAFSPETAPELWEPEIFRKLRRSMDQGGVLVTYCAKGRVRRTLQDTGFSTERLPGPPGKWEMLRATAQEL